MKNIGIRKMRVFLAAIEMNSFTKASVAQNISQPAATIIINQIEEAFGCELFQRQGAIRKALPTERGGKVAETFSRIVGNYDAELSALSALSRGERLQRRILIQTSYDLCIDRGWLKGLMDLYAQDELSVEVMPRAAIVDEVTNRKATLGLIDGNVDSQNLDYVPLGVMQLLVAVPKSNPAYKLVTTDISWQDIGRDVVLFSNVTPELQRQVNAKVKGLGAFAPRITRCDSSVALISMLQDGCRAAIVPDAMESFLRTYSDCRFYRFSDVTFSGQFGLVTPWGKLNRLPGEIVRVRCCFSTAY